MRRARWETRSPPASRCSPEMTRVVARKLDLHRSDATQRGASVSRAVAVERPSTRVDAPGQKPRSPRLVDGECANENPHLRHAACRDDSRRTPALTRRRKNRAHHGSSTASVQPESVCSACCVPRQLPPHACAHAPSKNRAHRGSSMASVQIESARSACCAPRRLPPHACTHAPSRNRAHRGSSMASVQTKIRMFDMLRAATTRAAYLRSRAVDKPLSPRLVDGERANENPHVRHAVCRDDSRRTPALTRRRKTALTAARRRRAHRTLSARRFCDFGGRERQNDARCARVSTPSPGDAIRPEKPPVLRAPERLRLPGLRGRRRGA